MEGEIAETLLRSCTHNCRCNLLEEKVFNPSVADKLENKSDKNEFFVVRGIVDEVL